MEIIKKFVEIITLLVVILFLWFAYSLIRFDGFFHPIYTLGLSDPYEYHQKYVSSKLMEHGKEYKIFETETSQWNIYRDRDRGFEFKYPLAFLIEKNVHTDAYDQITFSVNDPGRAAGCAITAEWWGWKLGKHGLPSERRSVEFSVQNKRQSELHFIRDQYGGALQIGSTRFSDVEQKGGGYTGVTFIHQEDDQFVHLVDHGNTCDEAVMQGMLATFRFVE